MKYAISLLAVFLLLGCQRKSLRDNPTYKLSKAKGIVADSSFLFLAATSKQEMDWPDVHCFDSNGKAIMPYNCANSISKFIRDLSNDQITYLDTMPDLKVFLDSNIYLNPDGERLSAANIPRRNFYVFYHYLYIMIEGTKTDSTILQRIRDAQNIACQKKILLYLATQTSEYKP